MDDANENHGWVTAPQCERCWINRNSTIVDGVHAVRRPVRLTEPELEQCAYCGLSTIFGVYVRAHRSELIFRAKK